MVLRSSTKLHQNTFECVQCGPRIQHFNMISQDQKREKTSKNIVTFFAAVSPTERLEDLGENQSEDVQPRLMTEAIITDNRPNASITYVADRNNDHGNDTIAKSEAPSRVKRSDDDELDEDDDGPEGRVMVNPNDDHEVMVDVEDDAPYEYIQAPDDHEDIEADPNDVAEQTEDAGDHDDDDSPHDDDTNAVVDVSDDIDNDDHAGQPFKDAVRPVQEIIVHKKTIPVRKGSKRPRYSYHVLNAPKESHLFKMHTTDHSTVTKPKAKHSQYRHQNNYDINWAGEHRKPTYETSSQKTITRSNPSSTQFYSPQTQHGFFAKGNPGSSEDVDLRTKFRSQDKSRTDIKYNRMTPSVKKKETHALVFDESYRSRGLAPPRWSSSYIRFEEPNSPLLSGGEHSFDDHPPTHPIEEHPITFPNEEIVQPTIPPVELPTASSAVLATPAYNPDRDFRFDDEDAKMKSITEEIDDILRDNFEFSPRYNPPRKEYYSNILLEKEEDDDHDAEKEAKKRHEMEDNWKRQRNEEEERGWPKEDNGLPTHEQREDKNDIWDEFRGDGEADREQEEVPHKDGEAMVEEELSPKNDEKTKGGEEENREGDAVEEQGQAPPEKGEVKDSDGDGDETPTTEGDEESGRETTEKNDAENDGTVRKKDPTKNRGPVQFQTKIVPKKADSAQNEKIVKCVRGKEKEKATTKKEDTTDKGDDTTDEEDDATEKGEDTTDKEEDATEKGDDATEKGDDATEKGDDATENGEDATERGEDKTEKYKNKTEKDDDKTEKDEDNTEKDEDKTERDEDKTEKGEDNTGRDEDNTGRDEDNTGRDEDNTGRDEDNTGRDEDNTGRDEDNTGRDEDNTEIGEDKTENAEDTTDKEDATEKGEDTADKKEATGKGEDTTDKEEATEKDEDTTDKEEDATEKGEIPKEKDGNQKEAIKDEVVTNDKIKEKKKVQVDENHAVGPETNEIATGKHGGELEKKKEKSKIEKGSKTIKGKPEKEKDQFFIEEYKQHGGHDYEDFETHRHKTSDNERHKHHGREEGGHDHKQEQGHKRSNKDHISKLQDVDKQSSQHIKQKHLTDAEMDLQSGHREKKENQKQENQNEHKWLNTVKENKDVDYKSDKDDYRTTGNVGSGSLDKIPVIEIFDSVPNVDYTKHPDGLEQSTKPPLDYTTTDTPTTTTTHHYYSITPNPNQDRVESRPQEVPASITPSDFPITSYPQVHVTTDEALITTSQDSLLSTTSGTTYAPPTTPHPLPVTTPQEQLLTTTPHELITPSSQEGRIASTHQTPSTASPGREETTTTSSRINIDQVDKLKSDQHNALVKHQGVTDNQLKKQKKKLNQATRGWIPGYVVPVKKTVTEKKPNQQWDWPKNQHQDWPKNHQQDWPQNHQRDRPKTRQPDWPKNHQWDWQNYQQQLYYPKPTPKPIRSPSFITVESTKRKPPILVEDVDYREFPERPNVYEEHIESQRPYFRYYV